MDAFVFRLNYDGYIFIETPNIDSVIIWLELVNVPRTFLLSRQSFQQIDSRMGLSVISLDCTAPYWKDGRPNCRSN